MTNRYQTHTFTSASINGGASLNIDRTGLPSLFNIVKVKVVPNFVSGTFDLRIYKKDTFLSADLLALWDDVPSELYYPVDIASGVELEALEGPGIPYDDIDGSGELHIRITNNGAVPRTFDVTIEYEEIPLFDASGNMTLRGTVGNILQMPFKVSTDYNFTAQVPGGTLSAGVPAVVTLILVPEGVNGTNSDHYLYISNGIGTAEAVLITGGTAVSGAASGTITFTPANSHTGAWTITSATAGIQEAINSAAAASIYGGSVYIPAGMHNVYAKSTSSFLVNIEIWGAGPSATKIANWSATQTTLDMSSFFGIVSIHDLLFYPQAVPKTGIELLVHNTGFLYCNNVHCLTGYSGIRIQNVNNSIISNVAMNSLLDGIGLAFVATAGAMGGSLNNIAITTGGNGTGCLIEASSSGLVTSFISTNLTLQGGVVNLELLQAGSGSAFGESLFNNTIVDSATICSVRATCQRDGYAFGLTFNGLYGGPNFTNATCVDITDFYAVSFNDCAIAAQVGSDAVCMAIRGSRKIRITDSTITSTGIAIYIVAGVLNAFCSDVTISNNDIGKSFGAAIQNKYALTVSAAAHTAITVRGNNMYSNIQDLDWAGTGLGSIFKDNLWGGSALHGKPVAATFGAQLRGSDWFTVSGAGVADTDEVLRKDAANAYAWVNRL